MVAGSDRLGDRAQRRIRERPDARMLPVEAPRVERPDCWLRDRREQDEAQQGAHRPDAGGGLGLREVVEEPAGPQQEEVQQGEYEVTKLRPYFRRGARMPHHHHRADDGPAYLTILIVGHIMAPMILWAFTTFRPEPLVLATVFTIGCVALSLYLLPRLKGAIVGFQWAKRMHGFGGG